MIDESRGGRCGFIHCCDCDLAECEYSNPNGYREDESECCNEKCRSYHDCEIGEVVIQRNAITVVTETALKPCPFCGITPMYERKIMPYVSGHRISCKTRGCYGFNLNSDQWWTNKEAAIAAWNQRAEPIGNPDVLPEWAREEIEQKYAFVSHDVQEGFNEGYMYALKWALSLRKPEEPCTQ